ncbi:LOW QUALITY PROTEIN: peroxisomal N(1)-acetyl-spermine/spermidine oxidase [Nematostella vectensis]|uniref:LOW QUALITY PROTEIN: peroxisomal N(1)-acetyl-spermine/spermidine oxidase n=1 Tax=Nematostella vectensis TaxID=45351 RepID=UPI0020771605|nr:LOW QUALITY PROTEIN: peroxisomal N(1)-acetyl-spermine/spermidine oxidase [Nematostella vectensis]
MNSDTENACVSTFAAMLETKCIVLRIEIKMLRSSPLSLGLLTCQDTCAHVELNNVNKDPVLQSAVKTSQAPPKRVAVVGAGMAGFAVTVALEEKGFDVVLLEASDYLGGRVRTVKPFKGFPPVDLGADFIHGSENVIHDLAHENNWKINEGYDVSSDPFESTLYHNGGQRLLHGTDPDIRKMLEAEEQITKIGEQLNLESTNGHESVDRCDNNADTKEISCCQTRQCGMRCTSWNAQDMETYTFDRIHLYKKIKELKQKCKDGDELRAAMRNLDISLATWLTKLGATRSTWDLMECTVGQNYGAPLSKLGLLGVAEEKGCWGYGPGNYRFEGSYEVLVSHFLKKCPMTDIRTNWPVRQITWSGQTSSSHDQDMQVTLKSNSGEIISANYVVITVPLTILKDGDIIFSPPLPREKELAIERLHMSTALKIVCRFKKPFWGQSKIVDVAHGFISQIWTYTRDQHVDGEECHVLVGFQSAEHAAQKVHLEKEVVRDRFLEQLDQIFGSHENPRPASQCFMSCVYYHWSKHPYVRGGYSASSAHAYGMRSDLAKPVSGRLFFAGEATHVTNPATVQAAIETGRRAASEVFQVASSPSTAAVMASLSRTSL